MFQIEVVELLNGEKLVGELELQYSGKQFTIRNPVVIVPQKQEENGDINFALILWPLFRPANQDSFVLNAKVVVTHYTPNDMVMDHYTKVMYERSKKGL